MRSIAGSSMALLLLAVLLQAQTASPPPLTLVTPEGRRPIPTTTVANQEVIALDDIASLFQVTLREDTLAGGMTVTYRGRSIVLAANQSIASVDGRVVALSSPVVRDNRRWLVPLEFLPRALAPIYDRRIELRRPARLLIVGDVRVPRVTARLELVGAVTRATLEVTPAAPVTIGAETGRVLLRIDADALDVSLPPAGAGLIDQIRAGDQPNTIALTISPRAGTARTTSSTTGTMAVVTVDVPPAAGAGTPAAPGAPPPGPPPPAPPLSLRRPVLGTIVVDPGHGGADAGVRGPKGLEEKRLTLDAARRLKALLETRLGVRVVLTREDDRGLSLDERTAVANNNNADVFVSLHANGAPTGRSTGAEVFSVQLDDEGQEALGAADAESIVLPILGGATRRIDVIRWDLAQARHVDASGVLAQMVAAELQGQVPMAARPLQQRPIRVLMGANMPSVLVEMGYLTNSEQESAMPGEAFQTALAQALFDAIVRFGDYLQERRPR